MQTTSENVLTKQNDKDRPRRSRRKTPRLPAAKEPDARGNAQRKLVELGIRDPKRFAELLGSLLDEELADETIYNNPER